MDPTKPERPGPSASERNSISEDDEVTFLFGWLAHWKRSSLRLALIHTDASPRGFLLYKKTLFFVLNEELERRTRPRACV